MDVDPTIITSGMSFDATLLLREVCQWLPSWLQVRVVFAQQRRHPKHHTLLTMRETIVLTELWGGQSEAHMHLLCSAHLSPGAALQIVLIIHFGLMKRTDS